MRKNILSKSVPAPNTGIITNGYKNAAIPAKTGLSNSSTTFMMSQCCASREKTWQQVKYHAYIMLSVSNLKQWIRKWIHVPSHIESTWKQNTVHQEPNLKFHKVWVYFKSKRYHITYIKKREITYYQSTWEKQSLLE